MKAKQPRGVPIVEAPKKGPIEVAIDTIEQRKMQADFGDLVRLAEQVFPKEWNVRVEPFSDGVHVQVRYYIARGPDPITALRKAIDWYREQKQSRIILPNR